MPICCEAHHLATINKITLLLKRGLQIDQKPLLLLISRDAIKYKFRSRIQKNSNKKKKNPQENWSWDGDQFLTMWSMGHSKESF